MVSKKTKQEEERQAAAAAVNKSLLSIDYASKYPSPVFTARLLINDVQRISIYLIIDGRVRLGSRSQRYSSSPVPPTSVLS